LSDKIEENVPELPEVETVVRSLAPHLPGRAIIAARFTSKFVTPGNRAKLSKQLAGRTILSVRRRGKFILMQLDRGTLVVHLGMTGKLLLDGAVAVHTYGEFTLSEGVLLYEDPRQFGRIEFHADNNTRASQLGPEPLEVRFEEFHARMENRKTSIKALLLNQKFLAGVGNIYADEALFLAGIHPLTIASRISAARAGRLHHAIRNVLTLAIEHRGSSISDYVDADGNRGDFQLLHRAYGREGEPCVYCGAPVKKIVVAQRGTHFCPQCQKR
jgi:formamidopyrimidine-DNA glycosylase